MRGIGRGRQKGPMAGPPFPDGKSRIRRLSHLSRCEHREVEDT